MPSTVTTDFPRAALAGSRQLATGFPARSTVPAPPTPEQPTSLVPVRPMPSRSTSTSRASASSASAWASPFIVTLLMRGYPLWARAPRSVLAVLDVVDEPLQQRQRVVDGEGVMVLGALAPHAHQPGAAQHLQVMRDRRPRARQLLGELGDVEGVDLLQQQDDLLPRAVAER